MNDYAINYEDERFKNVENEKQDRLNQINDAYTNMINQSDQFYQNQINAAKDYATTQQDLQNQQTQLAIDEINQQKEKAQKDYIKEQKGAYTDWQKQSNRYGVEAERQAQNGLLNSGYSESSQVSMYNTYQNRVSTARDSYNLAVQNYDNGIAQARLANNSKLAEIAYQALQTELELSLNGFQYKNNLLLDQISKQQDIDNTYYNRWQNVLSQMNTENSMAEQIRQFNEKQAEDIRQYNETMALNQAKYDENIRQFNAKMDYQKERDAVEDAQWQKEFDLAKKSKSSSSSSKKSSSKSSSKSGSSTLNANNTQAEATLKASGSPNLSSGAASIWFAAKAGSGGLTASKLANIVTEGLNSKILTESDKAKIYKAYGLS